MVNRAVFLDRDGTIVEDPGFLHEPEKVTLLPGAAEAIRRLNEAGYRVVIVTNQSGIARRRYTVGDGGCRDARIVSGNGSGLARSHCILPRLVH